ncbi:hypothetical protein MKW94_027961, partial [Papaver nudicaule]|nr:hypothetical protein [Papaver nudicaule]
EFVPVEVEHMGSAKERSSVTTSPLLASTLESLDNDAPSICAFCQTPKVSELAPGDQTVEVKNNLLKVVNMHTFILNLCCYL